jgi:hypothetical protein
VALKDFLPVNAVVVIAPLGIVVGLLVGLGTALLFLLFLLPYARSRRCLLFVPPMKRVNYKDPLSGWFSCDPGGGRASAVTTTASWFFGLWFAAE